MLVVAVNAQRLEADLTAGRLACPGCGGRLSPWGFARSREVRMLDSVRSVRPRRVSCVGCCTAHVLAPAWSVPGRRDAAEVIGEALRLAAGGQGHRRIARRLGRPPGTVRGWLHAARARARSVRACGVRWAYALDPATLDRVTPAGSELGDAVEAIMLAVRARTLRFGHQHASAWERAV